MLELRKHQTKAIKELDNGRILVGDVGTGKSRTAVGYYLEHESPRDVYVITTAKKRDSLDWVEEFLQGRVYREGPSEHGQLVVDSWNNIHKYTDVRDAFFIFDEQRLVGKGAWVKSFIKIARDNRWILLSATPGDTWLDYVPVFVANGFYRNRTEFVREHVVYKPYVKYPVVDRYVGTNRLVKYRNLLLVEMPYERHTCRHEHEIVVDYDKQLFERVVKQRWHVYEDRPLTGVSELFSVMRRVVNSDSTRLDALRSIMRQHPRVIVFYNFDYELEILRGLLNSPASDPTTRSSSTSLNPGLETSGGRLKNPANKTPGVESCQDSQSSSKTRSEGSSETRLTNSCSNGTERPSTESFTETGTSTRCDSCESVQCSTQNLSRLTSRLSGRQNLSLTKSSPGTTTSGSIEAVGATDATRADGQSSSGSTGTSVLPAESTDRPQHRSESTPSPSGRSSTEEKTSTDSGSPSSSMTTTGCTSASPSGDDQSSSSETTVALAEWNGHKHDPVPTTDRWVYLVQYTAGSEGWNCITTDAMVFFSLNYSYRLWHQAHGRIDRLNTPFTDLHYYRLVSRSPIDRAIWQSLKGKKTFNESAFVKEWKD